MMTRPTECNAAHPLLVATDTVRGWTITTDPVSWVQTGRHLRFLGTADHPMVSLLLSHLRQIDGLRLIALRTTPVAGDWEPRTPETLNLLALTGLATGDASLTVLLEHLALLLGTEETHPWTQRPRLIPRPLTPLEHGVLAHALATLMADQDGGPQPTLPTLIEVLEGYRETDAHDLARRLRGRWSGSPADPAAPTLMAEGRRFFAPSDDDIWALRDDATVFDFSPIPEGLRPFFLSYALERVGEAIEPGERGVAPRRTVLVLDDLDMLRVIPSRLDLLANLAMAGRSRGVTLFLVDAPRAFPRLTVAEQQLRTNSLELLLEEDGGVSLTIPERRVRFSLESGTATRTPEEPPMGRGRTVRWA